jgi:hypothetical protein
MDKMSLTEEQKKAVSLNLGHAHVGTTFGAYGYGNMNNDDVARIIREIGETNGENRTGFTISKEDLVVVERILKSIGRTKFEPEY